MKELDGRSITPTPSYTMHLEENPDLTEEIQNEKAQIQAKKEYLEDKKAKFDVDKEDALKELKADAIDVAAAAKFSGVENGLTLLYNEFDPKITEVANYLKELKKYEAFASKVGKLPLTYHEEYQTPGSSDKVSRFGINTPHLKGQIGQDLASIYTKTNTKSSVSVSTAGTKQKEDTPLHMLHPLEVSLIKKAIEHSQKTNLIAIADIFEKDVNGKILCEDDGTPKIHSITLSVQGDKVKLVDPSNSEFSRHVAYNGGIIFSDKPPMDILVPKNKVKIYSTPEGMKTGPSPDQPRDCINIAVLIADVINSSAADIDVNDLFAIEGFRQITNQRLTGSHHKGNYLFFYHLKNPLIAKIEQASDTKVRQEVHRVTKFLNKQVKAAELYEGTDLDKVKERVLNLFSAPIPPNDYAVAIDDMKRLVGEHASLFKDVMESEI